MTDLEASPAEEVVRSAEKIVPMTIKQINTLEHRDDKHFIDNTEQRQIKIVGQIVDVQINSVSILYTIDDATGTIIVDEYSDHTDSNVVQQPKGTYVSCYCRLISSSPEKVSGLSIRPLLDFNEISYHRLHALFVHLCVTRGIPPTSVYYTPDNYVKTDTTNNTTHSTHNSPKKMDNIDNDIKEFISSVQTVTKESCIAKFAGKYSAQDIDGVLSRLSYQGAILDTGEGFSML